MAYELSASRGLPFQLSNFSIDAAYDRYWQSFALFIVVGLPGLIVMTISIIFRHDYLRRNLYVNLDNLLCMCSLLLVEIDSKSWVRLFEHI